MGWLSQSYPKNQRKADKMLGLSSLREQMPVTANWCYLDHAAVAPIPRATADAMVEWTKNAVENGAATWGSWRRSVEEFRTLAAGLLDAYPDEIGFIRNTTEGISLVAHGWDWSVGDSIVVPDSEFPSNLFPWMTLASRGVDVRRVPNCRMLNGEEFCNAILEAVDHSTRIVAVSWVDYSTGRRRPLDQLAASVHQQGALLFVDAIQGLGAFPLSVKDSSIDFLAADGHKWLLGPEGAGIFFVKQSVLNRLQCTGPGWNSVVHAGDFDNHSLDLRSGTARFEAGTYPAVTLTGLLESLKLLNTFGIPAIKQSILKARSVFEQAALRAGARCLSIPETEQSGIISLECPLPPRLVVRQLRTQGILANVRNDRLRISPHAYHSESDVEQFEVALRDALLP